MATTVEFVEYVHEQSGLGSALVYKKMFGEYALYVDGKVVALACDNSLYVKPTRAVEELALSLEMRAPYRGAKPHVVVDELLDDGERLKTILLATASALPVPCPKPAKKRRAEK